uniref:Uncharacterized protein n=1 Tax=Arundo donax TaxID=35708 RepID=A0A0A9QNY0_ARUDO
MYCKCMEVCVLCFTNSQTLVEKGGTCSMPPQKNTSKLWG